MILGCPAMSSIHLSSIASKTSHPNTLGGLLLKFNGLIFQKLFPLMAIDRKASKNYLVENYWPYLKNN